MKLFGLLLVLISPLAAAGELEFRDMNGQAQRPFEKIDKALVLIFIAHDCPIANKMAPEIKRICGDFGKRGVRICLVHAQADLTAEAARKHAAEFGYDCPVLLDPKHELVKHAGATVTPEAAVFSADGKLQYRGRINDLYVDLGKPRFAPSQHDLREALEALLAGKEIKNPRTQAVGCLISDMGAEK